MRLNFLHSINTPDFFTREFPWLPPISPNPDPSSCRHQTLDAVSSSRLMTQLPIYRNTAEYGNLLQTQHYPRARALRPVKTEQEC